MPNYLTEADWKTVLNKPKNLGLRAQGTGVSNLLREYERKNGTYHNARNVHNATDALHAVQALKAHVNTEKTKHKAFTEATQYLDHVHQAAVAREVELLKEIGVLGSVDVVKDAVTRATDQIQKITTYDAFTDMNPSTSLLQKIRAAGASCDKVTELKRFAAMTTPLTDVNAITKENWKQKQLQVAQWLIAVKAAVDHL